MESLKWQNRRPVFLKDHSGFFVEKGYRGPKCTIESHRGFGTGQWYFVEHLRVCPRENKDRLSYLNDSGELSPTIQKQDVFGF